MAFLISSAASHGFLARVIPPPTIIISTGNSIILEISVTLIPPAIANRGCSRNLATASNSNKGARRDAC